MENRVCLDPRFSTTRLLFAGGDGAPSGVERCGGLRTEGYYKKNLPDKPLISVITVVFNTPDLLERTMESVTTQNYDNVEYIVIDGGSTEKKTVELLKNNSSRIDLWISEPDSGIYDAMNKGIGYSGNGGFLNFLNAGDLYASPESLSRIACHIAGEVNMLYCNINYLEEGKSTVLPTKDFSLNNLLRFGTGVLCHQAVFIHKPIVPPYATGYRFKGELNWYFDIIENKSLRPLKVNEELVNYATGGFGHTHFISNRLEWLKVVRKRYGFKAIIKNDLIVFLLRNSRYRYAFVKRFYFLFLPVEWACRLLSLFMK